MRGLSLLCVCVGAVAQPVLNPQSVPITFQFLNWLDNHTAYNRYATPTVSYGHPTDLALSTYIEGMSSFDARTMDFRVDMYFQQEWIDPRLEHNESNRMLIKNREVLAKIWHPDVYFANTRSASFEHVTGDNFLVWIEKNGTVFYDCRVSMTVMCMMDLSNYPLDSQFCELRILSYAYDESQLVINWTERFDPITLNPGIKMPDMHLLGVTTGKCDGEYATGVWSCVTALFVVKREIMHHVMQTYLPTGLIVVISWFSFWLDVDATPARVSLSITTLLTIATQANAVKLSLPEVSYMKAIDVWMGMCMTFVFGVMIEFTVCHFARNRQEKTSGGGLRAKLGEAMIHSSSIFNPAVNGACDDGAADDSRSQVAARCQLVAQAKAQTAELRAVPSVPAHMDSADDVHSLTEGRARTSVVTPRRSLFKAAAMSKAATQRFRRLQGRKAAIMIDRRCRIAFPLTFLIFNLVYWFNYMVLAQRI